MSRLSIVPEATYPEPIQGWRCWRILPFKRLDGTETYRLSAVGTNGLPKTWEPLKPTAAVCSSYGTDHEAPWPAHECGIWALNDQTDSFRRMVRFMGCQTGEKAGWAFGQVSLWGRVIEHEKGWRGQYAYPYSLAVHSLDPDVARIIRDEYLVDVEWAGAMLYGKVLTKQAAENEKLRADIRDIRKELSDIAAKLRTPVARITPSAPTMRFVPYRLKEADYLAALKTLLDKTPGGAVSSRALAEVLAEPANPALPLGPGEPFDVALTLLKARLNGRVVQLRRGKTGRGACLWTLPGRKLSPELVKAGWWIVPDKHADFDNEMLAALKATLTATSSKSARTRDVLAHLGEPDAKVSRKLKVARAFDRMVVRGKVRVAGGHPSNGSPTLWALAGRSGRPG
jgi:hypothetical protein